MTATESFAMLQQLAEKRRDACAVRLGRALTELQGAEAQMRLLAEYRADYATRLESTARKGIAGGGLRNYQAFLDNLERAIAQQTAAVEQLQAVVERVRAEVAAEQRQVESFAVLLRRHADAQGVRDNRRQQSLQDEFAASNHIRHAANGERGAD